MTPADMDDRTDVPRASFAFMHALRVLLRPRYRAELGGGTKLTPIADILAQTGREPPSNE